MGANSKIEWCDSSWNPIRARRKDNPKSIGHYCEHVSQGCAHCYAETLNHRFGTGLAFKPGHRQDIEIFVDMKMLRAPLGWKRPKRIFVGSMTDLFADFVTDEMLDLVFAAIAVSGRHTFQILTKRPKRMRDYMSALYSGGRNVAKAARDLAGTSNETLAAVSAILEGPLPHVWLGISCEDKHALDERWPSLARTPAAIRFLSYEPALGPLDDLTDVANNGDATWDILHGHTAEEGLDGEAGPRCDWIIVGGESGAGARPMRAEWVYSVVKQCRTAGVACFVKQMGPKIIDRNDAGFDGCDEGSWNIPDEGAIENDIYGYLEEYQGADCLVPLGGKGADMDKWPEELRIREFPPSQT